MFLKGEVSHQDFPIVNTLTYGINGPQPSSSEPPREGTLTHPEKSFGHRSHPAKDVATQASVSGGGLPIILETRGHQCKGNSLSVLLHKNVIQATIKDY